MTSSGDTPVANLRRRNGREEPWKVKFFGVGNEAWGCGGSMRPEYYADEYRRYRTFARNFGENRLYTIACGANDFDYEWTEVLMRQAARYLDGLSLHYYTVPGTWENKGSATEFTEDEWFVTLKKAMLMDELVSKHAEIMDRYDPEKRTGMIVDEWGSWYDVEPGTNPHFLYQQNSLRDALVAGVTLNIFNSHCDRVYMANLAQSVNVLQALLLTREDKILLTPTYHVFDMYQVHQGATLLQIEVTGSAEYIFGEDKLPQISASASMDEAGTINVTICNVDSRSAADLAITLRTPHSALRTPQLGAGKVSGSVLAAPDMRAHNTFDRPDTVKPVPLERPSLVKGELSLRLAPMSVTLMTIGSGAG